MCVLKPAYSVSFLLSINIFVRQNVLYFPKDLYIYIYIYMYIYILRDTSYMCDISR